MNVRRSIGVGLLVTVLTLGCAEDDPVFNNPFDPRNANGLPVPTAIETRVGSNLVRLSWQLADGDSADEFAVFRRRMDDSSSGETLVRVVKSMSYDDRGVRNGTRYGYRIASGRNGSFGTRSELVEAQPVVVSIILANGAPKTRTRTVSVASTAPNAITVKLAENSDPSAAPPRSLAPAPTWTLSSGDGAKAVYAVFQFDDGSESVATVDSIALDTRAQIRSVNFDEPSTRAPGEAIRFTLDANNETDGNAVVQVPGLFDTPLSLFDDGASGDVTAGDGIYTRQVEIPSRLVSSVTVTGRFTDDVGNEATPLDSAKRLTVQEKPDPVQVIAIEVADPPDAPGVTVRWTQHEGANFARYDVFRSESTPVDSSSKRVGTLSGRTSLEFDDTSVVEGRTYHYRVYVVGTSGLMSGSIPVQTLVPNVRPPVEVVIQGSPATSSSSIVVRWSRSPDRDFSSYRLYRNKTGAVSEADVLVETIDDVNHTMATDALLEQNTTYFYRVFTYDTANLNSCSAEVNVTTEESVTPDSVSLLPPTLAEPPDGASVTLRWTQIRQSDFAAYRVFRAENAPVEETDELLHNETSSQVLQYIDRDVIEGRDYAYRVFVVLNSGESRGSNTQEITVPNLRAPTPANLQTPDAVSSTRLAVRWSRNTDADFLSYALFRNETGAVNDQDEPLGGFGDRDITFFDDTNLVENTTYYYRLYTYDEGGLSARSNQVVATTRNEPPVAVELTLTASDSSSATFAWDASATHDFAAYRLYRDVTPTVTPNSTLVVEIDEIGITTFRDTGLESATEYSYRVFVVDDGRDPGPESTGSNTITFTTD